MLSVVAMCLVILNVVLAVCYVRADGERKRERYYIEAVIGLTADVSVEAFDYPRSLPFFRQAVEAERRRKADPALRADRALRYIQFTSGAPLNTLRHKAESEAVLTVERELVADFVALTGDMMARGDDRALPFVESFTRNFGCHRHPDPCESLLRGAIALSRRQGLSNSGSLAAFESELAGILRSEGLADSNAGRHLRAELRLREAIALYSDLAQRKNFGGGGLEESRHYLGYALHRAGRADEAVILLESVVERLKQSRPNWHTIVQSQELLARALGDLGRYEEAESILLEVNAALRRMCPYSDLTINSNRHLFVQLYERWGKPERANAYRAPIAPDSRTPVSCAEWRPTPVNR